MLTPASLVGAVRRQAALDDRGGAVDAGEPLFQGRRLRIGRQARPRVLVGEGYERSAGRLIGRVCGRDDGLDDVAVTLRIDRKAVIEIPGGKAALGGIVFQRDLAGGQRVAIGLAQHRQQHAAAMPVGQQLPTDVERRRARRFLAPLQHVHPPGIVGADRHVVGHEVEDQPEPGALQRGAQARESVLAAELRIERAVIDDVIAVQAAGTGFQKRRRVEMRDAERFQIRHDARGIVEAEVLAQLQAIGGERHIHGATGPRSRHRPTMAAVRPAVRRPRPACR